MTRTLAALKSALRGVAFMMIIPPVALLVAIAAALSVASELWGAISERGDNR